MTLVLEDGTGLTDSNSYASVAEANAYFANRAATERWQDADPFKQEQVLIWATDALDDHCVWLGVPVKPCAKDGLAVSTTPFQALRWPRVGCPSKDPFSSAIWPPGLLGSSIITYQGQMLIAPTIVPPWLKKATMLVGKTLLLGDRLAEAGETATSSVSVSGRSRTVDVQIQKRWAILTPEIRPIIDPYRITDANVVRA